MANRSVDDEWLAEKLKAEANRHEPDLDRIRQRIRERGIGRPVRRSTWLVPAAAATFVIVTAGVITAVNSGQLPGPSGRVDVVGPARTGTASQPTSPATSPSGAPSAESTASSTASSSDSSTASESNGSAPSKAPKLKDPQTSVTNAPPRDVELELVAAQPDQAVTLPGNAVDWIATGSESANETVRRERGEQKISGPHETGNAISTTTNSPFSVSWTGGIAERSHSESRKWRTVSGPVDGPETGLILRVPAQKRSATVVLYVGASGADGWLRTKLGGQGKMNTTRLKAVNSGGYVATIQYHTDGSDDQLTVELIAGSGGSISFAAASLR